MDFRRRVLLVGIPDPGLSALGVSARTVEVRELADSVRSPPPGCVVVLGDGAFVGSRPDLLESLPAEPTCFALACAPRTPPEVVSSWARAGRCEFVPPGRLVARVLELAQVPIRHPLPSGEWPPEVHRLDARWCEALSVLADLPHLTAEEWARALGLDRHRLYRLCVRSSDKPPERLVWECLHAVVRNEEAHGVPRKAIHLLVGYASPWSLERGLARRWD